ncbi:hypothetical protein V8C37DRAFT_385099 [Trichoderma ceciliae]
MRPRRLDEYACCDWLPAQACYVARLLMPRGRSHAAQPRNLSALSNCVNYLGRGFSDGPNLLSSLCFLWRGR